MLFYYCRVFFLKEYFVLDFNLFKMYNFYVEKCVENDVVFVKFYMYCNIFNIEFNLGFYVLKKDRCDQCMEYQVEIDVNKVIRIL